jgi:hypothetical protein
MRELVCSPQCPQYIAYLPFSQNLNNKDFKKTVKKTNKEMSNLGS